MPANIWPAAGWTTKTIAEFRIGFAPDSGFLLRDALRREFDEELLKASGLFSWKEHREPTAGGRGHRRPEAAGRGDQPPAIYSKFRNRVMFPICNEGGQGDRLHRAHPGPRRKAGPKYLNSPETPIYSKSHVLFNLDKAKEAIRKLDYAILVEGQMDCISVFAAGLHNVIASSGTAFTETQARLLARFSKNIVVNFDPDTAGAAAAERSLAMLVEQEFQIKVVTLEQGYRSRPVHPAQGSGSLRGRAEGGAQVLRLSHRAGPAENSRASPEGKVKALISCCPTSSGCPAASSATSLANEIAQKLASIRPYSARS